VTKHCRKAMIEILPHEKEALWQFIAAKLLRHLGCNRPGRVSERNLQERVHKRETA